MNMIPKMEDQGEVSVGKWSISEELGIVSSPEDKSLILEPRLSKLLYLLALNHGAIISRQYLTDRLWPDTIVNEESLTRAVADLRKILVENLDNPPPIETLRKRGYNLTLTPGPRIYRLKLKLKPKHAYILFGVVLGTTITLWLLA